MLLTKEVMTYLLSSQSDCTEIRERKEMNQMVLITFKNLMLPWRCLSFLYKSLKKKSVLSVLLTEYLHFYSTN